MGKIARPKHRWRIERIEYQRIHMRRRCREHLEQGKIQWRLGKQMK
jgi:hypothetical protein